MSWIGERAGAAKDGIREKRYILLGLFAAAIGAADRLFAMLGEHGVVMGIPSWTVGVMFILLVITWWFLEYAVTLRAQLAPKLRCSFAMTDGGCVRPNTTVTLQVLGFVNGQPTGQLVAVRGTYYRLAVLVDGVGEVPRCTGYVTSILRNGKKWVEGENLLLTFVPAEAPDATNKDLRAGITNYLDFFFISDDDKNLFITTKNFQGPSSINWHDMFVTAADYMLHVVITPQNSPPIHQDIQFHWTGQRSTSRFAILGHV